MADASFNSKIYTKQGGAEQVTASGGTQTIEGAINIESGGTFTAKAGSTIDLSAGSVDLPAGTVVLSDVADGILTGAKVEDVAANNVIGGIPVVHEVTVPDGATGDVDVVLTHKTRIIDVVVVKTGGAGGTDDTITVKNGATAITNAISIDVADKAVARAGTIDDAQHEIAAAGTLKITRTKVSANNAACIVYVYGIRKA